MAKKLITLYKEWMDGGELPEDGLCNSLFYTKYHECLDMFEPTDDELIELAASGLSQSYWGSGLKADCNDRYYAFTPLRQTIVLLICAMNNEL